MKKVYIGLGNPGEEYQHNRHNAGFMFVDFLIEQWRMTYGGLNSQFEIRNEEKKLNSIIISFMKNGEKCLMVKPQTYMNHSGQAVKKVLDYYKYSIEDLAVIYDDLDIRLGDFKIHEGLGPRSHNGVLSLEEILKTQTFTQIRVGVDNRDSENRINGEAYVLQNFTKEEEKKLFDEVFPQVFQRIP